MQNNLWLKDSEVRSHVLEVSADLSQTELEIEALYQAHAAKDWTFSSQTDLLEFAVLAGISNPHKRKILLGILPIEVLQKHANASKIAWQSASAILQFKPSLAERKAKHAKFFIQLSLASFVFTTLCLGLVYVQLDAQLTASRAQIAHLEAKNQTVILRANALRNSPDAVLETVFTEHSLRGARVLQSLSRIENALAQDLDFATLRISQIENNRKTIRVEGFAQSHAHLAILLKNLPSASLKSQISDKSDSLHFSIELETPS